MRVVLAFVLCGSLYFQSFGQDTLLYRNGTRELVHVIQGGKLSVKYNKWLPEDTSQVHIKSSELVSEIIYQDGPRLLLVYDKIPELPKAPKYNRNYISLDVFDLLMDQITLSYQYTFSNSNLTLRIPISTSFKRNSKQWTSYGTYYSRVKNFSTGIDIMHFPFNEGNTGFIQGLSFEIGESVRSYGYPNRSSGKRRFSGVYYRGGFLINRYAHLAVNIYGDIGIVNSQRRFEFVDEGYTQIAARLKIGVGYTF